MACFVIVNKETGLLVKAADLCTTAFDSKLAAATSLRAKVKRMQKSNARDEARGCTRWLEHFNYEVMSFAQYQSEYPQTKVVRNMMTGAEVTIGVNTPSYCDPSSEAYWSS